MAYRNPVRKLRGRSWKWEWPAVKDLVLDSTLFTWVKESNSFVAESSTLQAYATEQGYTNLQYKDGRWCFHMRSARTGRVVRFDLNKHLTDHKENEKVGTVFECEELPGVMVIVYND